MSRLDRVATLAVIACLSTTLSSPPCGAQPALSCGLVNQPAATIMLPYFEVDLENPAGRSTLFSVGNAASEATLAHAVLWTNWGHPVLSFDFFVTAGGVRSFNVRSLLRGRLPRTSPPASLPEGRFASCTVPVTLPAVDPDLLAALLTGQPHPEDGLCYSAAVEGGRLATGFITVDAVHDCSGTALVTPNDDGYLGDCATGLATNDNVLWGDFFLVDPAADFAQGEKLVPLIADQARFGEAYECVDPPCGFRISETFYRPAGNRMPLARTYEARFLRGGGFDGGTELVVWVDGSVGPAACGEMPGSGVVTAHFRNEAGEALGSHTLEHLGQTFRVAVGGDRLPVAQNFGCVELGVQDGFGSYAEDRQLWVMPLVSGEGRYSVGLNTVPVEDFCQ